MQLRHATPAAWTAAVLDDFDSFLIDHAAAERKASASALAFVVRYPDRTALLEPMTALALEELHHFHQVLQHILARGLALPADTRDPYVGALLQRVATTRDGRLLDRLLLGSVVEARGCERFGMVAAAIDDPEMADFYALITESEQRHTGLFADLARTQFDSATVADGVDRWLDIEAEVASALPIRAALH